jgi:tetratricopeptide (TPR) repeat protein
MKGDIAFVELLCDVGGMDLWDRGRIDEAYWINKKAENILDSLDTPTTEFYQLDGPDKHILTGEKLKIASLKSDALTIAGLSTDFMALTKRQEGLEMRRRCKDIRRICFRSIPEQEVTLEDKIRLYNSYGDLAISLQQLNDFSGVRKNMEECLKNFKRWGDEQAIPYEYAKYYSMTSFTLIYERDYRRAVEYAEKAYKLIEGAYPGTSSAILHKSDYALILFQTGQGGRQEAHGIMKDLLVSSEKDCGEDNLRTLELRMIYGIMLYYLDKFEEAR